MAGPFPHVQAAENEMLEMKAAAKTNGEIAQYFNYKEQRSSKTIGYMV